MLIMWLENWNESLWFVISYHFGPWTMPESPPVWPSGNENHSAMTGQQELFFPIQILLIFWQPLQSLWIIGYTDIRRHQTVLWLYGCSYHWKEQKAQLLLKWLVLILIAGKIPQVFVKTWKSLSFLVNMQF